MQERSKPERRTNLTASNRNNASWDFSESLDVLTRRYAASGEPVTVNFRDMVPIAPGSDRATHLIHPYPAKLLPNIPLYFANCKQLSHAGDLVLDPFCGTGTVLLEAILAGRRTAGSDANPLARLITKVKLCRMDAADVESAFEWTMSAARTSRPLDFSPVVKVDHWYSRKTARELGKIISAINQLPEGPSREFLRVSFSSCVKRASHADPRLSVPVRKKGVDVNEGLGASEVRAMFARVVTTNIDRLARFNSMVSAVNSDSYIGQDARDFRPIAEEKAELVITSPPYNSAQKYIRSSSLSIGWLGLAPNNKLRTLERLSIGREHFDRADYSLPIDSVVPEAEEVLNRVRQKSPLRAHIAATYLQEMQSALSATVAAMKPGGHFVLVIGNNTIAGEPFHTERYISTMLRNAGLTSRLELIDDIRSRGLMTKRNKTAGLITQEHIHVLQKG